MSTKQPGVLSKKKRRQKHRESGFEEWGGYMAAKKQKLEMQFEDNKALELMDQKETKIFKGICIFVNGHTDPPADDLKRLMLIHGGTYHHYSSSKTTHIIASNLPKSKMKLLKTKTFVTANWITDSIEAGKLLPHHNYLLYTPEVADGQHRLDLENYFQKKPNTSSNTENDTAKESSSPKNKNEIEPTEKELFGEDSESDSSIDSVQNAQCNLVHENLSNAFYEKHSTSHNSKVSSPVKSFSNVNVSKPPQNQTTSYDDSSHLKSSLCKTEKHTFNVNSYQEECESSSNELFKSLESDFCLEVKNISVDKNCSHKKSSVSHQKHVSGIHGKVPSPMKSSPDIDSSLSAQNQSIPYKNSSNLKPTFSSTRNQTFNERSLSKMKKEYKSISGELSRKNVDLDSDFEQDAISSSASNNSSCEKSLTCVSHHIHDSSNLGKVSSPLKLSPNVEIPASSFPSAFILDSSMDSEQNTESSLVSKNYPHNKSSSSISHEKHGSSNHGKALLPIKSSPSIDISTSSFILEYSMDSKQNTKSTSMSRNSYKESFSNISHTNQGKVSSPMESSPYVDISSSSSPSNYSEISPLTSSSNVEVSVSAQNQRIANYDSSHFKPSSSNDVPVDKFASNMESNSKSFKTGDTAISPQKVSKAVKAGDPNFLPEFFNHSRKHHISTSAQELKRYVQFLVENNKEKHFPKRDRLHELSRQFPNDSSLIVSDSKGKAQHVIMHLDMDCFFVSVGLKKHPELRGVPVAVTHSKGKRGGPQEGSDINYEASHYTNESNKKLKGVISGNETSTNTNQTPKVSIYSKEYGSLSEVASCSYEARKAGVRNGQFLGEALRRCPNLQTIPYDFEGYSEVSKQLYDIVASYTLDIEAVSCDELYIDCTELLHDVGLSPHQFSSILRAEIEKETGCTASAGMGSNMLLARLATKVAKPNGQHYVNEKDVEKFMEQQKVGDLPGVGYTTVQKLRGLNIRTCGDLQRWSLLKLQQEFGPKTGQAFYNNCRGKDDKVVQYHKDRKSVSAEVNYGIRFETEEDIYNFIKELSTEVQNRIRNLNCKGNQVTLKLMARKRDAPVETAKYMGHGVCDNYSKSIVLKSATDSAQVISKECYSIARSFKISPQDYRGVGIQLGKLVQNRPVSKDHKPATNVLKQSSTEPVSEMDSTSGVFAPKSINKVNKVIPEKATITHFLSNKSSPTKRLDSTVENNPVKNISPLKQTEPTSKHGQRTKRIEHFLSNKPSTSRAKSYNVMDYLPEELDLSVIEALPDDLKKEILEYFKLKSVKSDKKALNQDASTSSASEQSESTKSLHQEQSIEKFSGNADIKSYCFIPPAFLIPAGVNQRIINALTDGLRKGVSDSYEAISNKNSDNATLISAAQQPSTSFASKSNNPPKVTIKKNTGNGVSSTNSILMTELDESVFNALPEDLKKEVLASYGGEIRQKYKYPDPSTSNQKSSKATSRVGSEKHPVKKKPTLGGAVELEDLRALIKEWIDSTDDPQEEDVNDLKIFLIELCDFELNNVEILLQYLYRLANKANQKWKDMYLAVLSIVQAIVFSKYKSTLMLSSEFPT